jgi:hypothetical protein
MVPVSVNADPVNGGTLLVPAGVPALTAWLNSTAAAVVKPVGAAETDSGAREVPTPKTEEASILKAPVAPATLMKGNSWAWFASGEPEKIGAPTVPVGV